MKLSKIFEDLIPGGYGDNKPDSDFDEIQLKIGQQVEMEHTNDPKKAKEVAKDHLSKDKNYYSNPGPDLKEDIIKAKKKLGIK
jgi:hypothetical protein